MNNKVVVIVVLIIVLGGVFFWQFSKSNSNSGLGSGIDNRSPTELQRDANKALSTASSSNSAVEATSPQRGLPQSTRSKALVENPADAREELKPAATESIASLDQYLESSADGRDILHIDGIEKMDAAQLQTFIVALDDKLTEQHAAEKKASLLDGLNQYFQQNGQNIIRDFQCSNKLCGLVFESVDNDPNEISDALDKLSFDASFKTNAKGGLLMMKNSNGSHLGVVIMSISDNSVSLVQ